MIHWRVIGIGIITVLCRYYVGSERAVYCTALGVYLYNYNGLLSCSGDCTCMLPVPLLHWVALGCVVLVFVVLVLCHHFDGTILVCRLLYCSGALSVPSSLCVVL